MYQPCSGASSLEPQPAYQPTNFANLSNNSTSQTLWLYLGWHSTLPIYDCGRTFVQIYTDKARDPLVKKKITQMMLNGSGVRDTVLVLSANRNKVSNQFKKSSEVVHVNPVYIN